jgi:hypothetical protein
MFSFPKPKTRFKCTPAPSIVGPRRDDSFDFSRLAHPAPPSPSISENSPEGRSSVRERVDEESLGDVVIAKFWR